MPRSDQLTVINKKRYFIMYGNPQSASSWVCAREELQALGIKVTVKKSPIYWAKETRPPGIRLMPYRMYLTMRTLWALMSCGIFAVVSRPAVTVMTPGVDVLEAPAVGGFVIKFMAAFSGRVYVAWQECSWILKNRAPRSSESQDRIFELLNSPIVQRHLAVTKVCGEDIRDLGISHEKIMVFPYCTLVVGTARPFTPSLPIVMNAASIQPRKGPDTFSSVADMTKQLFPEVEFQWVGGFEKGPLGDGVTWIPHVYDRSTLDHYFERGSIFLFTSRSEAFGLAVIEAMSHGMTVVAFEGTGAAEVCGDAGVVVTEHTPEAFFEAVKAVLLSEDGGWPNKMSVSRCRAEFSPGAFAARATQL